MPGLGLSGISLNLYAFIFGITKPDDTGRPMARFEGSVRRFAKIWNISVGGAQKALNNLISEGLISSEKIPQTATRPKGGTLYWVNPDPILALFDMKTEENNEYAGDSEGGVQKVNTRVRKVNTPTEQQLSEGGCSESEHPCSKSEHIIYRDKGLKSSLPTIDSHLEQQPVDNSDQEERAKEPISKYQKGSEGNYRPILVWLSRSWAADQSKRLSHQLITVVMEYVDNSQIETSIEGKSSTEKVEKISAVILAKLVKLCGNEYHVDPERLRRYLGDCSAQKLGSLLNRYLPDDFYQYTVYDPKEALEVVT